MAAIGEYTSMNNGLPVANLKSSLVCNSIGYLPEVPVEMC